MVVVCHVNVRSLAAEGRLSELKCLVAMNGVDILCLTETWLKSKHMDSSFLLPGFQPPFRQDRTTSRGGGVAVYIRCGWAVARLPVPDAASNIECLPVRIELPRKKKLTLITVYRPPHQDISEFDDALEVVLDNVPATNLMVLGDFNARHSAWFAPQGTAAQGVALKLLTDTAMTYTRSLRPLPLSFTRTIHLYLTSSLLTSRAQFSHLPFSAR